VKFDKETVIVLVIAGAVLVGWSLLYPKYAAGQAAEARRIQQETLQAGSADSSSSSVQQVSSVPDAGQSPVVSSSEQIPLPETSLVELKNELVSFQIDALSGSFHSAELLSEKFRITHSGNPIQLYPERAPHSTFEILSSPALRPVKLNVARADEKNENPAASKSEVTITRTFSNGLISAQTYTLANDTYAVQCTVRLSNLSEKQLDFQQFEIALAGLPPLTNLTGDKVYSDRMNLDFGESPIHNADPTVDSDEKFQNKAHSGGAVDWIASSNKFFASLLVAAPENPVFVSAKAQRRFYFPEGKTDKKSRFVVPSVTGSLGALSIPPGASRTFAFTMYCGPKEISRIKALHNTTIGIMHVSYYSWFEFIARPMVQLLNWLNSFCNSYGIAIILLTIIVRLIFWPVTQKANSSMRRMQKIQPKMTALRDKYKENPSDSPEEVARKKQALNRDMMELYRVEKVNPMGGCLPVLLQIPVFIALYSALDSAVELRHVSFLWCTDLARPDLVGPQLPFALPFLGQIGLHPLVLIMTALMVLQQKMTPSTGDPAQQKMMMLMPVIMLFMLYNLPSGLTLYWTVSQIFSILQMKYGQYAAKRDEARSNTAHPKKA